jgi:hypothetical protein
MLRTAVEIKLPTMTVSRRLESKARGERILCCIRPTSNAASENAAATEWQVYFDRGPKDPGLRTRGSLGASSYAGPGFATLDMSSPNDETPREKVYALFIDKRHCKAFADTDCVGCMRQHRSKSRPKLDAALCDVVRVV